MDDFYRMKLDEGKRLAREGRTHEAIDCFLIVTDSLQISHLGHYYAGLQFFSLGIFKDALKHFEQVLERKPYYAEALDRRCLVLYLLKRSKEGRECLERAGREPGDHHYIHQFIELKDAGYDDLILPDFESDPNARLMLDASVCLEFLGVGSRFHTPQLQRFLERYIDRVIVTRTVMSEVHAVLEKRGRQNDPAIQERLGMLEAAVMNIGPDSETEAEMDNLLPRIIAGRGKTCCALWIAKSRDKAKLTWKDGQIVLPDEGKLMAVLHEGSSNDKRIVAESVAVASRLSCRIYLLTTDFDMSAIAVHIYRISKEMVLPVRPEQIMWI